MGILGTGVVWRSWEWVGETSGSRNPIQLRRWPLIHKARPASTRAKREREVKLTSYILALLCYWRALQLFVLRKFLTESFANFLSFLFSAWITEFTLLSSVNLFPAHSFIPFLLCSVSLSKRLRMSWPCLFHPFTSFRTLLNIILHRSWPLPVFWKCSTLPVPFTWSLCFFSSQYSAPQKITLLFCVHSFVSGQDVRSIAGK